MLKKDFAVIAVRLLALYIVVMIVNSLPAYIGLIGTDFRIDPTGKAVLLSGIVSMTLDFIMAFGLWFYSSSIANLISKGLSEAPQPSEEFTLDRIQVVAVSLVGLLVLSSAIPALFEVIFSYLFPESNPRYTLSIIGFDKKKPEIPVVDFVKVAVKLGLGFWFMLGANGIVTIVRGVWAKGKTI
jgi:hypothetical protein